MRRFGHYAAVVAAFTIVLLGVRCANMNPSNTSEVGNPKLTGHLVDGRTNTPADSAIVHIYPVYLNKMAKALGKVASGAPTIDSTLTDHNGLYQFDNLANGIYSIEGEKVDAADTLSARHPSVLFIGTLDLGYDTLQLPGSIKGKIIVPGGESAQGITCYIPGTSYIAITNDTGGFRITGIPAGTYSLSFSSSRFNDTTLYNKRVGPAAETDIGSVTLSFDMNKNVHDVWGVFDSISNYQTIGRIEARVTGDNIPVDTPRIYPLDWRPDVAGYSGFIYVPPSGSFWKVAVWVYDVQGHRIGAYQIPINRSTGNVQFPAFDPRNGIPTIGLHDTTVNINESVLLHPGITKLADDSIVSMVWDIGNTGTFIPTSTPDTLIIAPNNPTEIQCVFRVTDRFGNSGNDTMIVHVVFHGMVAYWSFDSSSGTTYYDVTGHGYDATATGTGVGLATGVKGQALSCPGSGYDIAVANSSNNFNLTQFSVESWFYSNIDPSGIVLAAKILDFQYLPPSGGLRNGYSVYIEPTGHVSFGMSSSDGSAWEIVRTSTVIAAQTWYFVTATYDSSYMRIYLNGVLSGSLSCQGTYLLPGADARIGCQRRTDGVVSQFVNGKIDQLKLYNYALPVDSIADHYYNP